MSKTNKTNMELIQINTDNYIVVNDSEIKEGDMSAFLFYGGKGRVVASTKSEGFNITKLSLQEVKELIGEVDVDMEKKALKKYPIEIWGEEKSITRRLAFEDGYNQALEDNKDKKYTEADLRKAIDMAEKMTQEEGGISSSFIDKIIQSLQPKTEWEVQIIDGKLKLK